jgi:hypothetical protein
LSAAQTLSREAGTLWLSFICMSHLFKEIADQTAQ